MTRRETLVLGLRYLVTGGFAALAWRYLKGPGPSVRSVAFSKPSGPNEVMFQDGVYLVGLKEGPVAFAATCPHLGCTLDHQPGSDRFRCPCHGSEFGLDGRRLRGPATTDMTALELRADSGCGRCSVTLSGS